MSDWIRFEDQKPEVGQEIFIVWSSGNYRPEYRTLTEEDLKMDWSYMRWMPVPDYKNYQT